MHKTKNSVYDLQYHLVLVTKYRHSILSDDIAYCLTDIIYEILENRFGANIIELNIQTRSCAYHVRSKAEFIANANDRVAKKH